MQVGQTDDPGHIRGRDWRELADAVGVAPRFVRETVRSLAEALPGRARRVAAEMTETYGRLPVLQQIQALLRRRSRRRLQLLRQ
jgi:hypothetical protein